MEQKIYNIKERPPRTFTKEEIGFPIEFMKNFNVIQLIQMNLAPLVTSVLAYVLKGKFIHGRPVKLKDIMVTMNDGAKTALDVYFPRRVYKKRLKCPTILIRTPYWKNDLGSILGSLFTQIGFVCVVQDIRGTGHSNKTGISNFLIYEKEDAQDIINWMKTKFWWNGKLSGWGASYLGMTQWCIIDSDEYDCFLTILSSPRNVFWQHNGLGVNETSIGFSRIQCDAAYFYDNVPAVKKEKMSYFQYTQKFMENPATGMDPGLIGQEKIGMDLIEQLSRKDLISVMKGLYGIDFESQEPNAPAYEKFILDLVWSPKVNRFHEFMTSNIKLDYSHIKKPNFMVAGWYDMFIKINMIDFQEIMAKAGPLAKKYTKMIVGPWAHGGVRHPTIKNAFNGGFINLILYGANVDWLWYWLKDADSPDSNEFEHCADRERIEKELIKSPPLKIFTFGRNKWRYEHEWPLKRTIYKNLYLHSSGSANSWKGEGILDFNEPSSEEQPDKYDYDPANPVLTRGGNNLTIPNGAFEQIEAESRDDVLVYTTEKLKEGIEFTGDLKMILYASSSAVDTDFMVKVCEVYPNGKSYNISDLGIRARYRDGVLKKPTLIEPDKVYKYEITLWPTSYYVKPGHRIRIDITSSDFPKYNINSNMGGKGSDGDYVIAKQKIYHDKKYPSHLILPVIP
ncbi:MAG: CocE/NonD family hydrolase [Candidatus Hodarchaeota archaeon]